MPSNLVVFSATVKEDLVADSTLPNPQPCAIYPFMDFDYEFVEWVKRQLREGNLPDKVLCDVLDLDKDEVSRRLAHQRGWTMEQMHKAAVFLGSTLPAVLDQLLKRRPSPPGFRAEWSALCPSDPEEADALIKVVRMARRDIPKRRAPRRAQKP